MKKDTNFDLKGYLIENKMTENSRGDVRKHFTGEVLLKEMKMPVEEAARPDKDALYREYVGFETKYGRDKAIKIFQKFHPDVDLGKIIPRFVKRNQAMSDREEQARLTRLHSRDRHNDDPNWEGDLGYFNKANKEALEEAGYTDDDYDDDPYEKDLDFTAGDSLASIIAGTNKKARRAFEKDAEAPAERDDDEDFKDPEEMGDDEEGEEDAEDNAPADKPEKPGEDYAAQIKYDPKTVELYMDEEELNSYLGAFRRPAAAVRTLNRAIKATQTEVNESIGLKYLYIVLGRGFYHSSRMEDRYKDENTHEWLYGNRTIAKVSANEEWRKKNFDVDTEDDED